MSEKVDVQKRISFPGFVDALTIAPARPVTRLSSEIRILKPDHFLVIQWNGVQTRSFSEPALYLKLRYRSIKCKLIFWIPRATLFHVKQGIKSATRPRVFSEPGVESDHSVNTADPKKRWKNRQKQKKWQKKASRSDYSVKPGIKRATYLPIFTWLRSESDLHVTSIYRWYYGITGPCGRPRLACACVGCEKIRRIK